MRYNLFIVAILIGFFNCSAQEAISGKLSSWEHGPADVIMMMTGEPFAIGTVDESGDFNIPLKDDILEKTKKAMAAQNESSSGGRFTSNPLNVAFSCDKGESLKIENGDQVPTTLATMGGFTVASLEKKKMFGSFMIASSEEFAEAFSSYGQKDALPGYYLNWYYLEEPASIKGTCALNEFSVSGKDKYQISTTYKLQFKKGWNLVKVSVNDTYTHSEGKVYSSKFSYNTIKEMPKDVQYVFLNGQ
jgi:hypothetical protein